MATVFQLRLEDTGEEFAVKVFNPTDRLFRGIFCLANFIRDRRSRAEALASDFPGLRAYSVVEWKSVLAAMIQRQVGLQRFLRDAFKKHEQDFSEDRGRFSVAEVDEDPYFLNAGVFVQPWVSGRIAETDQVDPTARAMIGSCTVPMDRRCAGLPTSIMPRELSMKESPLAASTTAPTGTSKIFELTIPAQITNILEPFSLTGEGVPIYFSDLSTRALSSDISVHRNARSLVSDPKSQFASGLARNLAL